MRATSTAGPVARAGQAPPLPEPLPLSVFQALQHFAGDGDAFLVSPEAWAALALSTCSVKALSRPSEVAPAVAMLSSIFAVDGAQVVSSEHRRSQQGSGREQGRKRGTFHGSLLWGLGKVGLRMDLGSFARVQSCSCRGAGCLREGLAREHRLSRCQLPRWILRGHARSHRARGAYGLSSLRQQPVGLRYLHDGSRRLQRLRGG